MKTEAPSAMQYWQSELTAREEGTKQRYCQYFSEFLSFVGNTKRASSQDTKRLTVS